MTDRVVSFKGLIKEKPRWEEDFKGSSQLADFGKRGRTLASMTLRVAAKAKS